MDFGFDPSYPPAAPACPAPYGYGYGIGHPAPAPAPAFGAAAGAPDLFAGLLDGIGDEGGGGAGGRRGGAAAPAGYAPVGYAQAPSAMTASIDDGFLDGLLDGLGGGYTPAPAPAPAPAPKAGRKRAGVRFGAVEVRYITPVPEDHTRSPAANAAAGFGTSGFGALGSVGEMEAYEAQALGWGAAAQPRRPCAPISASRLVQRRWRANAAAGPR